jgi:capsular exopolysaccharide synthesis family protein
VRVIERAEVPYRPSRPKIPLNLALGVFSGLVIAVGAAFAREYLDSSLKSSDEVENLLQLPALAAIPNFALARRVAESANGHLPARPAHGGDELLVMHEPWSRVAEAFRSMRTLLFANTASAPKVILVTSARPGEGKTVASLNLASALAELGARTLLIDADLRNPRCHTALGVEDGDGLSSWLSGQVELDALIRTLDVPGLFFLPAGPPPRSPAELVASPRMQWALALLRERFDVIVLDTPPVLAVTDAAVLAREVDGVVLVARGHTTEAEAVRRARDQLALAGARILGVVMNDVGLGWGDPYFYESYYSYGGPRRSEGARA